MMEKMNVTQAARQFSELLNRVAYQNSSFELERGGRPVARLVPAAPAGRVTVAGLNDLFATLPPLGDDSEHFERDVASLRAMDDPWASSQIPMS